MSLAFCASSPSWWKLVSSFQGSVFSWFSQQSISLFGAGCSDPVLSVSNTQFEISIFFLQSTQLSEHSENVCWLASIWSFPPATPSISIPCFLWPFLLIAFLWLSVYDILEHLIIKMLKIEGLVASSQGLETELPLRGAQGSTLSPCWRNFVDSGRKTHIGWSLSVLCLLVFS